MSIDNIELYLDMIRQKPLAILFTDGDTEAWIPKSQILRMKRMGGSTHEVVIPEWLAVEKGLC